jgi:hypothetical protein
MNHTIAETRADVYFVVESLGKVKEDLVKYCLSLDTPGSKILRAKLYNKF